MMRIAFALLSLFVACQSAIAAENYRIDFGKGKEKSSLVVYNQELICCNRASKIAGFDDEKFEREMSMEWSPFSVKLPTRISIISKANNPQSGYSISCDPEGKDPHLIVLPSRSPNVTQWRVTDTTDGFTIEVVDGKFKGLYLSPGKEDYEVEVGKKKFAVGTRPILDRWPAYFNVVSESP